MHQFLLEEKIDFYLWVSSEKKNKKKKAGLLGTYMHAPTDRTVLIQTRGAAWWFLHAGELRKEKMHSILTTYHSFASYLTDTDDEPCCNRTNIALGCRCEADAETDADAKRLLKTDDDDDTIHTTASPLISTEAEAEAEAKQGHGQEGGSIDTVHIVWMNHLDVGFTNNIASVLNIYWHEYFPKAIQTAKEVK